MPQIVKNETDRQLHHRNKNAIRQNRGTTVLTQDQVPTLTCHRRPKEKVRTMNRQFTCWHFHLHRVSPTASTVVLLLQIVEFHSLSQLGTSSVHLGVTVPALASTAMAKRIFT